MNKKIKFIKQVMLFVLTISLLLPVVVVMSSPVYAVNTLKTSQSVNLLDSINRVNVDKKIKEMDNLKNIAAENLKKAEDARLKKLADEAEKEKQAQQAETARLKKISDAQEAKDKADREKQAQIEKTKQANLTAKSTKTPVTKNTPTSASTSDRDLLAKIVQLEDGSGGDAGREAVVSCILNRVNMSCFGNSVSSVIFAPGQFSTASVISNVNPSQACYDAVDYVLNNGSTLPSNVVYFRSGGYGSDGTPYACLGGNYYSSRG